MCLVVFYFAHMVKYLVYVTEVHGNEPTILIIRKIRHECQARSLEVEMPVSLDTLWGGVESIYSLQG